MDHLLTIGAFAQRCGLSRSALRFYDECGLLVPAAVDDSTGYRYYAVAQVRDAVLVKRLRAAEMPVGDVRRFLVAEGAERKEMLAEHANRLEKRAGVLRRAVDELVDEVEMPPRDEGLSWCTVTAGALAAAIGQVLFAAARGGERPELSGIWVEAAEGSLRLVATDSYRIAVRDLVLDDGQESAHLAGFLPLWKAEELRSSLAGANAVKLSGQPGGPLYLAADGLAVAVEAYNGSFPDYRAVLVGNPRGNKAVAGVRALAGALRAVPDEMATVGFTAGALVVRSPGTQTPVEASWDGPPLSMTLNAGFVAEALEVMVGPDVVVEANDALRPLTLRSADTGTLTVLTMPVRPRQ
ncbi:MAG: DNA polymerase III subunit beta family protein [Acidimicrobiales bacterium]